MPPTPWMYHDITKNIPFSIDFCCFACSRPSSHCLPLTVAVTTVYLGCFFLQGTPSCYLLLYPQSYLFSLSSSVTIYLMHSCDVFRSFQSLPLTCHSSLCTSSHQSLSSSVPVTLQPRHLTPTTITTHHTSRPIRPSLYFVPSLGLVAGGCQPRSPRGHHLSVPLSLICTRGRTAKREDGREQFSVQYRGEDRRRSLSGIKGECQ